MARIYVLGPASVFDAEFALYQQGQGWYYEQGFKNMGGILRSLDNTQVLLEEEESKFKPEHLSLETVTIMTENESKAFLFENTEDWFEPDPIGGQ